jgi:hypothetical protein
MGKNMIRRCLLSMVAASAVFGVSPSFAHETFRVIGVITQNQDSTITVKNKEAKTILIRIDKFTEITRDKKKLGAAELKVGRWVVADAVGDSEQDLLLGLEIRIVPPIKPLKE